MVLGVRGCTRSVINIAQTRLLRITGTRLTLPKHDCKFERGHPVVYRQIYNYYSWVIPGRYNPVVVNIWSLHVLCFDGINILYKNRSLFARSKHCVPIAKSSRSIFSEVVTINTLYTVW